MRWIKAKTKSIKKQTIRLVSIKERLFYLKFLIKFEGGIWSLLWIDLTWFLGSYIFVTILYHYVLFYYPVHRQNFERFLEYIMQLRNMVPLSFLLGFFVTSVLTRWWNIVLNVPYLAKASLYSQAMMCGQIGRSPYSYRHVQMARKAYLKYLNMAWIFAFIKISDAVRSRFTTRKGAVSSKLKRSVTRQLLDRFRGSRIPVRQRLNTISKDPVVKKNFKRFFLEEEVRFFERKEAELEEGKTLPFDAWIPLQWANRVLDRAWKTGLIPNYRFYLTMVQVTEDLRASIRLMTIYNEWKMPLVYIQIVIFLVYAFLFTEIFAQQIDSNKIVHTHPFNFQTYFPIMAILKYIMYMGWFNVGLVLIDPFHGDNPDMPLNSVLDYNLGICSRGGLNMSDDYPEFLLDEFGSYEDQLTRAAAFNDESLNDSDTMEFIDKEETIQDDSVDDQANLQKYI